MDCIHSQEKGVIYITEEFSAELCRRIMFEVWEIEKTDKPIRIIFDSCGGEVYVVPLLLNFFNLLKKPVTLIAVGSNFSASVFLLALHDGPRYVMKDSIHMLHTPYYKELQFSGDGDALRNKMNSDDLAEKVIIAKVAEKMGISVKKFKKMVTNDLYLTAEDMIKHNLADEILTEL